MVGIVGAAIRFARRCADLQDLHDERSGVGAALQSPTVSSFVDDLLIFRHVSPINKWNSITRNS
jgi:hypothetical protein